MDVRNNVSDKTEERLLTWLEHVKRTKRQNSGDEVEVQYLGQRKMGKPIKESLMM